MKDTRHQEFISRISIIRIYFEKGLMGRGRGGGRETDVLADSQMPDKLEQVPDPT